MAPALQFGGENLFYYTAFLWLAYALIKLFRAKFFAYVGVRTTPLSGPPSQSILFGLYHTLNSTDDPGALFERWREEYGPAFVVPGGFGSSRIVLCDPKASAHFYARETFGYVQTKLARVFIENLFGRGLLWAEGESHKRQRKALSPAFSNAAIRRLTSVFYDSSYKVVADWDSTLEANGGDALIDVQEWMNHISLDSIGIAGFGHDFGSLDGKHPPVVEVFETIGSADIGLVSKFIFLLGPVLPTLQKLPTAQNRLFRKLHATLKDIADALLERSRKEKEGLIAEEGPGEKSIIGLLIKAESTTSDLQMTKEEVVAQNVLLLAGERYVHVQVPPFLFIPELQDMKRHPWALIELSRKPHLQEKLRRELARFAGTDPTWEQLATGLPFLDAVVHEVLRLHPPVSETTRVATEDDVIPFSQPITTKSGEIVTNLTIAKGTVVSSPIHLMNKSEAFWGPDAREFKPERWLEDFTVPAKDIQGHRHLLTFSDGPRICLGRHFALAEFKAALSVLIRNYRFELPDGPETAVELHRSILPRPRLAGLGGCKMPLRVRRVE